MKAQLKFSVPDWCMTRKCKDVLYYYQRLKSLGIEAVEMAPPECWALAGQAGLKLLDLSEPGMHERGLNRREHHAALLPQIRERIKLAGRSGIPYIIIFSGNRAGQSNEEGIKNCVQAIRQLLPDAAAANVILLFEMLNSHDHQDYQADSSVYGFKLVRSINSPWFKLLYDIFHMRRMGEDVLEGILAHLDQIAHFHVAEIPGRTLPAPEGATDYPRIIRAVQAAGYSGYWGLEFIPQGDPLEEINKVVDWFNSFY